MKKTSLPARAISVVLSTMLAFTMMPAAAFASNADASSTQTENATAQAASEDAADSAQEGSAAHESGDAATDATAANTAKVPAVVNEEHPVGTAANAATNTAAGKDQPATSDTAQAQNDAPQIVQATVNVAAGTADAAVLSYNGMNFQITSEGTAALVGLNPATQGALEIPAAITSGGQTYAVTNICTLRGGGIR